MSYTKVSIESNSTTQTKKKTCKVELLINLSFSTRLRNKLHCILTCLNCKKLSRLFVKSNKSIYCQCCNFHWKETNDVANREWIYYILAVEICRIRGIGVWLTEEGVTCNVLNAKSTSTVKIMECQVTTSKVQTTRRHFKILNNFRYCKIFDMRFLSSQKICKKWLMSKISNWIFDRLFILLIIKFFFCEWNWVIGVY